MRATMKKKKGFKIAYVFEFVAFAGIVFSAAIFALMFLTQGLTMWSDMTEAEAEANFEIITGGMLLSFVCLLGEGAWLVLELTKLMKSFSLWPVPFIFGGLLLAGGTLSAWLFITRSAPFTLPFVLVPSSALLFSSVCFVEGAVFLQRGRVTKKIYNNLQSLFVYG